MRERPALTGVVGALVIAFSAILVAKADVTPTAAALWRCVYALPVLGAVAFYEDRRYGRRPWRDRWLALPAGLFFAADLIAWHHAIEDVGAGLATVLGNLQVVVVPFLALAILGEQVPRKILFALPLVCVGVLLVSGALESGAYGADPSRGVLFGILTGLTYAAFLLLQRQFSRDLRRPGGPLFDTTLVAALGALVASPILGEGGLAPAWPSAGWLITLAVTSQALGWLLITTSLPRLPAALTSLLLTIQPIGSVLLGAVLLGQEPSVLQLAGVACILGGLVSLAVRPRRAVHQRRERLPGWATDWTARVLAAGPEDRLIGVMVASVDARAAIEGRTGALSSAPDRALLRAWRTATDAMLVGAATLEAEKYAQIVDEDDRATRAAAGRTPVPRILTVSRGFRIDFDAVLANDPDLALTVYTGVAGDAPSSVEVVVLEHCNVAAAVSDARERYGLRTIACEGGPRLLAGAVEQGCVSDLSVTIAPLLVAGVGPRMLDHYTLPDSPRALELVAHDVHEGQAFLHYRL